MEMKIHWKGIPKRRWLDKVKDDIKWKGLPATTVEKGGEEYLREDGWTK